MEVRKKRRRAKTDCIDLAKLLRMLIRYHAGDEKVWSVVRVPSVEAEDRRQLHRARWTLTSEKNRHINRIKGLLATQGNSLPIGICMKNSAMYVNGMARQFLPGFGPD